MAVITISRDPGAFGEEIAARLAGKLGFLLIDKAHLVRLWREMDLDEASLARVDETIPPDSAGIDSETQAIIRDKSEMKQSSFERDHLGLFIF